MELIDIICQTFIVFFGCGAIWLVSRKETWRRWGYILGLMSQPFWFVETIQYQQWGMLLLSCWYTYSWGQGIYNYWIKEEREKKERENRALDALISLCLRNHRPITEEELEKFLKNPPELNEEDKKAVKSIKLFE